MNTNYPSIISIDHESNSRLYDPSYNTYSPYPDYTTPSKLEAFDYNYWPSATTTHNILSIPPSTANDQISIPAIETLVPVPSVHLAQINARTTFSATHHHHHIHQHLYPATPTSNDPPNWLSSNEYQSPTPYRNYSYPHNNFYDQSQWPTSTLPIKFESPCSPPSYLESSHHFDQQLSDSKEEPSDASYSKYHEQQSDWLKPHLPPIPPKNPTTGMSHSYSFRLTFK
jgi:hypothetical protein